MSDRAEPSYSQILRTSAITGGAQVADMVLRTIRTKVLAILLGPSGIGLISVYTAATEMIEKLSGVGVGSSAVRQVASVHDSRDDERLARTMAAVRWMGAVTGALGGLLTVTFSGILSRVIFDSGEHTWSFVVLGLVPVFNNLAKTEAAVIRGVRRIGDLARMQVLASLLSTIVVVSLYAAFHENGIVPALCASASILWLTSCRFSRRIPRMVTTTRWVDFWGNARAVMRMGVAFMWAGLLGSASGFAARTMIYHETGSEGTGIYQSAWALSGLFAQFVISAMGADFYPRLSVVSADNEKMNQYVNEQTEVGILLALPGLVATLMFGSLLIRALYSTKFLPATELLPWFVMGVLAQLISWPAGFIQLAKGASKAFALTETMFHAVHISFICIGLHLCGLKGVAFAFLAAYCWHIGVTLFIAYRLSGFRWSRETATLIIAAIAVSAACLVASHWLSVRAAVVVGSMVTAAVAGACARRLALRLGRQHVIYKLVQAIPGLGSGLQSR